MMKRLSFKFQPCPESNDHEVRILVNDEDVIGKSYLGPDPPYFFAQNFDGDGELMIGRCTCGVEGCDDFRVTVKHSENQISWTNDRGLNLSFPRAHYLDAIERAKNDHSWEDVNRTAERLATGLLKQTKTKDGFEFDWASARIKESTITFSYSKNSEQKLLEVHWDGRVQSVEQSVSLFAQKNLKVE